MKLTVLVADDEKNIREGLREALMLDGYDVLLAADGKEALDTVNRGDVDLLITDLKMPRLSGEELLKSVAAQFPTVPVIILTGHGTIESAVQAMHDGAYDFLTKPVNLDRLSLLVKRAVASRELAVQNRAMQEELERRSGFASIIGKSAEMKQVFDIVRQVAPSRSSVLITGESGSGKEMIAEALHYNSPRKDKSFIKLHCAALTESLLESELFGHEKGRLHGRHCPQTGQIRARPSRDTFPGRDRRDQPERADQASPRAGGKKVRTCRRRRNHRSGRAPDCRHEPRSEGCHREGLIQGGPLLPPRTWSTSTSPRCASERRTSRCSWRHS